MKNFRIHWLDKTSTDVIGPDIAAAMNSAGYGAGAVRAIDWYEELADAEGDSL